MTEGSSPPAVASKVAAEVNRVGVREVQRIALPVLGAVAGVAAVDYLLDKFAPGQPPITYAGVDAALVLAIGALFLWASRSDLLQRVVVASNRIAALETTNADLRVKAEKLDTALTAISRLEENLKSVGAERDRAKAEEGETRQANENLERERETLRAELAGLKSELAEKARQLDEAVRKVSDLEKQVETLAAENSSNKARADDLTTRVQSIQGERDAANASLTVARQDLARALAERDFERGANQRAPYTPTLDVAAWTTGFGILSPKAVHVRLTNAGRGVAERVNLSVAAFDGVTPPAFRVAAAWAAIPVSDHRETVVGDLNEFGAPNSLRVLVEYRSQFGPVSPIDMTFNVD